MQNQKKFKIRQMMIKKVTRKKSSKTRRSKQKLSKKMERTMRTKLTWQIMRTIKIKKRIKLK